MKKLLLALSSLACISLANAGSAVSTLTLNGSVVSSCTSAFTASTLGFTFTPGVATEPQQTTLSYTCTAGSIITAITSQSANGWRFQGTTTGYNIAYSFGMLDVSTPYQSQATYISPAWSTIAGDTNPLPVTTSSLTINPNADKLDILLSVAPALTTAIAPVDSYSDTVTITTTF